MMINIRNKMMLFPIFLILILNTGCIENSNNKKKDQQIEIVNATDELEGRFDSQETSSSGGSIPARVDFTLEHDFITNITFRFIVEDDDPDTVADVVDSIIIAEHDTDGEVFINYDSVLTGGSTPYDRTISMDYSNMTLIDNEWQLYFTVILKAGEDPWPGPIINLAEEDTGFKYKVEITYTYYPVNPYNNNI